jgi:hypothetical protein
MIRIGLCRAGALSLAAVIALSWPAHGAKRKKAPPAEPATPAAEASKTEALGTAGAWSAYASRDRSGRVCYLVGQPQKSDSAGVSRKSPQAMVTHRPSENVANVVSFVEGYPLKEGSEVQLEIDDQKFEMFTNDDSAWARTAELDRTIVTALMRGKTAVVKGTPQRGKATTDTYSLAGFSKALGLIDKACGIKRGDAPAAHERPHKKPRRARH